MLNRVKATPMISTIIASFIKVKPELNTLDYFVPLVDTNVQIIRNKHGIMDKS